MTRTTVKPEMRALVAKLRGEGKSYGAIAAILDITKNAAVGFGRRAGCPKTAFRAGMTRADRAAIGIAPKTKATIARAPKHTLPPLPTAATATPPAPPKPQEPAMIIPSPQQIALPKVLQFPAAPPLYRSCQFITGDRGPGRKWSFCDSTDMQPGSPYCRACHRRCHVRVVEVVGQ